jgi:hypothetical protein
MESNTIDNKLAELERLRSRVGELELELHATPPHWQASDFYTAYYATTGFLLGMFGAATSLLFNIVGSTLAGQHPLKLIQVYLTFPLGEPALQLNDGLTLAIGCCLYIATGMLLGIPFHVALSWLARGKPFSYRLAVGSVLAVSMWLAHFYLILAWLQPLLFGGNWIVQQVPWWVGALTHLVYGWTMVLVQPLGEYVPYRRSTEVT